MGSEGIQITIPTFDDDDDFPTTPIPFGRPQNFAQQFGQLDSPTTTPVALSESRASERSYFHSRDASVQSFESDLSQSFGYSQITNGRPQPSAHSSQTSLVSAVPTAPTKRPSFASIRNAFKSSAKIDKSSNAVPPVPTLDYPALRNPFSRSTSSLAQLPPGGSGRRPSVASPQPHRPPTPTARPLKRGNHSFSGAMTRSQSHGGSEGSVDMSFGQAPFSPPPVPKMPTTRPRVPTSTQVEITAEKISSEPRTPSEYALHLIFTRFVTAAEQKIELFVTQSKSRDAFLPEIMGPSVDATFDELLDAFARIAQKHAQALITSVLRWRKSVGSHSIKQQFVYEPSAHNRTLSRTPDTPAAEKERRQLAAVYLTCRALIVIVKSMPRDALGTSLGSILEDNAFEQIRRLGGKSWQSSKNYRANADIFGSFIGTLSTLRLEDISDRFISELKPIADGLIMKDSDSRFENIVQYIKHVQMKVYPTEVFEECADFVLRLSRCFDNAHGQRLKSAFAETFVHLLHAVGKTAQAEVNHPEWAKAIDSIFSKAKEMVSKPRYWNAAYPLLVSALCVAPHEYFLRHWVWCYELGLPKLKERSQRVIVMNAIIRLLWSYLFRCREPATTIAMKLETLFKHLFPPSRSNLPLADDSMEALTIIVHFVLTRNFDLGTDLTAVLLQEAIVSELSNQKAVVPEMLNPDRIIIAIQGILYTLTNLEEDRNMASWPSRASYLTYDFDGDYSVEASALSDSILGKTGVRQYFDRCGPLLTRVATVAGKFVGSMSMFDEQWTPGRLVNMQDDSDSLIVRQLPQGVVAYPRNLQNFVLLLQKCFESWPRCLHASMPMNDAVDMMIRGVSHVEPAVCDAATASLRRFITIKSYQRVISYRFTLYLFAARNISREGTGTRLPVECLRIVALWASLIEKWLEGLTSEDVVTELATSETASINLSEVIQSAALFLLSLRDAQFRLLGYQVLSKTTEVLLKDRSAFPRTISHTFLDKETLNRLLNDIRTRWKEAQEPFHFDRWEEYLEKTSCKEILESEQEQDRLLWDGIYPYLLLDSIEHSPGVISTCKDSMQAAVLRYHPIMSSVAEISGKGPLAQVTRSPPQPRAVKDLTMYYPYITQWSIWVRILCATALPQDGRAAHSKQHSRIPSDISTHRDRISSSRGLFKYIIPFLSSDHFVFRDSAVTALGSIDQSSFHTLLEDLQAITGHFYDARRGKSLNKATQNVRTRRQDRLYTAVAHIYRLTSPFIKTCRARGDITSLKLVLPFVRETQDFLSQPDVIEDWELQQLRNHFCGIVYHLIKGLSAFKDSDRYMSSSSRLKLFRLCEEWCLIGKQSDHSERRHLAMQVAASRAWRDPRDGDVARHKFESESNALSIAASAAMSALCVGAFFGTENQAQSPGTDDTLALDVVDMLDRLIAMLTSPNQMVVDGAEDAFRGLLSYPQNHGQLSNEVLNCSLLTPLSNKARMRLFNIICDIIINTQNAHFTFGQVAFLALMNLNHSSADCRRRSFNLLESIHEQHGGLISLSQFEAAVGSAAPNVYLHAQRQLSDILANEHSSHTSAFIDQATLIMTSDSPCSPIDLHSAIGNGLQVLEPWISHVDLMPDGTSSLPLEGRSVLRNFVTLTARFMDIHPEQVQTLWGKISDEQRPMNSTSTISFLMEQASKSGEASIVTCAARIVACFSRTAVGKRTIEDLCSFIEPQNMVAFIDAKSFSEEDKRWTKRLAFVNTTEDRSQTTAPAQLAWMFLSDVAPERAWELAQQLPAILHSLFTHFDHQTINIQQHARSMVFQVLRSWLPGMDELHYRTAIPARSALRSNVESLSSFGAKLFWTQDDDEASVTQRMKSLCDCVIDLLEPLLPSLRQDWGKLALEWGTSCPIRIVAFRSLQLFRILLPKVDKLVVASLIGRLSNTIADEDENIQSFSVGLLTTLKAIANIDSLEPSLLLPLFWGAAACLDTTVESEFISGLELLECLLERLDLDDKATFDAIQSAKPPSWRGEEFSLQALVLRGVRSENTSDKAFRVLTQLAEIKSANLVDPRGGRVCELYTVSVVWCLDAMDRGQPDDELIKLTTDLASLAEQEGHGNAARILVSFAKSRFRTKDDFARQAITAHKELVAKREWNDIAVLLLGMTLNKRRWMREKAMLLLKPLFQQRNLHLPDEPLSSEMLMPLLRLLQTDLAPQALDVLDVHMPISGNNGPAAKDVLRMSMHGLARPQSTLASVVFGMPSESGWSIANPISLRERCRHNAEAVFDSCKTSVRPSVVQFEPEVRQRFRQYATLQRPVAQSLGELMNALDDVNSYFQRESLAFPSQLPPPSEDAEDRAAEILGRALTRSPVGMNAWSEDESFTPPLPQTPFNDVLNVSHTTNGTESPILDFDHSSESDNEDDKFSFDRFMETPQAFSPSFATQRGH